MSVFGESSDSTVRLSEWMQTYYRRPRPDLFRGALIEALQTPGAFAGPAALPAAVFLSYVLPRIAATPSELRATLQYCSDAARATAGTVESGEWIHGEVLDTVLRAMYLAHSPLFDHHLEHITAVSAHGVQDGLNDDDTMNAERRAELASVTKSLYPSREVAGRRAPVTAWPLPSLVLESFQATLAGDEFPIFGASRFLFMHTHASYVMARRDSRKFVAAVPELARIVTESIIDGLWARFYATGDALGTVVRILDAATPYADFYEEYGDQWVTKFKPPHVAAVSEEVGVGAANDRYSGVPEEFDDDPYGAMRFATSRYAIWTLMVNASTHTVVGQAFARHLAVLDDRLSLMNPIDRETLVTAFGNKRVALMRVLAPAMEEMFAAADGGGIGSGVWPDRFTMHERGVGAPGGGSALRLVSGSQAAAGLHHTGAVLDSKPISGQRRRTP